MSVTGAIPIDFLHWETKLINYSWNFTNQNIGNLEINPTAVMYRNKRKKQTPNSASLCKSSGNSYTSQNSAILLTMNGN